MKHILILLSLFMMSCNILTAQTAPVRVCTTIEPLADWVRMVGGDAVEVTCLLPPGSSPHTFDPTPRDMRKASQAQVFLKIGLNLDNWGDRIAAASGGAKTTATLVADMGGLLKQRKQLPNLAKVEPTDKEVPTVAADAVKHDDHEDVGHVHSDACAVGHGADSIDPHFWMDPQMAVLCVQEIAKQLTAVAPDKADRWTSGAAAAVRDLQQLDTEIAAMLKDAPTRDFASFHDGYKYFAARYNLIRVAVIEEYPGKAPGDRYLMQVVRDLRRYKIKTVFIEPQLSPRVAQIIADEAGANVATLDPLGGTPGRETYIKNMRANAEALRDTLK